MVFKSAFRALLLLAVLAVAGTARAQNIDRIAAVVNDEVITMQDLDQRVHMAIVLSNLPANQDSRSRILPQVIRKMIDERLQLQEAARIKQNVTPADVDAGITNIEQQNRQPPGSLIANLKRAGVDPAVVREQIRADISWMRVVGRLLHPQIRVGEEEVQDRLEAIAARRGQPEYLVFEIFLPVDAPSQEEAMKSLGERLLDQLRSGAPFQALAQQFSRSPSAATGGAMGWISEGMLDDDLMAALKKMSPGEISPLIRAADGLHILGLVDRRVAGGSADPANAKVTLSQILLPVPSNGPPKSALIGRARELTQGAKSCEDFEAIGGRLAATKAGSMGTVRVGDLAQPLQAAVANVPAGKIASPVEAPDGVLVVMVCAREDAVAQLPTKEAIRRRIEDERLDMLARRHLRDLKRAAFIDVRM
ncbi:MAG: peptidylprolyl isomerase [Solirubrobacterales bacterium]